ncbi:uncharacterized protein VTP21DRAFT_2250 [Calcarisporiella thermophila]|uniref:uncharacterized protein n=1 Tax=Calcarisporiella thermophila TaxID=911321 RepID=UPI003743E41C
MTIHYTLCFGLLVLEIALFLIFIIPLPLTLRKPMMNFFHNSPIAQKVWYWTKITQVFVFVLFLDAVNRWWRIQENIELASDGGKPSTVQAHMNVAATRFYSERNCYLTGFTLFLSLILNRTHAMILENIRNETEIARLRKQGGQVDGATSKKVK